MKPTLIVLTLTLGLAAAGPASAQVKVDCNTPKVTKWTGANKALIETAKADCEQAKDLAKEGEAFRKLASNLRKEAGNQRKKSDQLRDAAGKDRKEADKRRKEARKLEEEANKLRSDLSRDRDIRLQPKTVTFNRGGSDTLVTATVDGANWVATAEALDEARSLYREGRASDLEAEVQSLSRMATLLVEQAQAKEEMAATIERNSTHDNEAAIEAERAAAHAEQAARISMRAALLGNLSATLRFLDTTSGATSAKKEVERAIKYTESHLKVLPAALAAEARAEISRSRKALSLQ